MLAQARLEVHQLWALYMRHERTLLHYSNTDFGRFVSPNLWNQGRQVVTFCNFIVVLELFGTTRRSKVGLITRDTNHPRTHCLAKK
jgi:hypothetical protein